ncbi:Aspartate/methionine/tyrosine aminotransferase [Rhizobiales bacterium GAS191]|nr:Aspartate/methionine/tyrosine aminotransferase [Rhizobiales bacterium GAS191]SEC86079.1 Aspartate/methionine/tyrosine aminotransferase [Rhizobiales bacterium GAS188]
MLAVNPLLVSTDMPPIPAASRWASAYSGGLGPLINMAQAVPGTPPPEALLDRLGAEARTPGAATYGPITGDVALREALALDVNAVYGADIQTADIAITTGCNQAFFITMMALARPGDEIILPAPWYFNHKMTLDMLGIDMKLLACRAQDGFVPSVEEARALIGPSTRAIVLVTPNNPTGATYPPETLAGFRDLAEAAGIALVVDETYRDFLPSGQVRAHELFSAPRWRDTVIQLYSFSKSYAVPGHRLGSVIAAPAVLAEIAKVLDCVQICPPRGAQAAIAWAVDGTRAWRAEVRSTINGRIDRFREVISRSPGWSISAIGAYFAYVRHPFAGSSEAAAERLAKEAGVLALPGSFFGPDQDRHIRFAFANVDEARLTSVAARLAALRE